MDRRSLHFLCYDLQLKNIEKWEKLVRTRKEFLFPLYCRVQLKNKVELGELDRGKECNRVIKISIRSKCSEIECKDPDKKGVWTKETDHDHRDDYTW